MRCNALLIIATSTAFLAGRSHAEITAIDPSGEVGICSVSDWKRDWPKCEYEDGVKEGRLSIVSRNGRKRFRVDYEQGEIGPDRGGIGWRFPITKADLVTLRYIVRFSPNFDWIKGGKLPGLSGGPESVTGGRPSDGKNGFSCRLMWRKDGRGEAYVYHKNQKGKYGDSFAFPTDFRFPTNDDISVRMLVAMNTHGQRNGKLRVWVSAAGSSQERLVVERDDMEWRSVPEIQIDSVLFESFHGGGDRTWAPVQKCWTEFGFIAVNH